MNTTGGNTSGGSELIAYFGYGSLVNLNTLQTGYVSAHPATLRGWRRHWQARRNTEVSTGVASGSVTPEQAAWAGSIGRAGFQASISPHDLALLSVHRDPACTIGGMLVVDRAENLPALDERERLYDRVAISRNDLVGEDLAGILEPISPQNLFIYVGQIAAVGQPPLLQSYLDTVMAGFLEAHGESGVEAFIASTTGFGREIIRDRAAPIYPRAVVLADGLADLFDGMFARAGVRYS